LMVSQGGHRRRIDPRAGPVLDGEEHDPGGEVEVERVRLGPANVLGTGDSHAPRSDIPEPTAPDLVDELLARREGERRRLRARRRRGGEGEENGEERSAARPARSLATLARAVNRKCHHWPAGAIL